MQINRNYGVLPMVRKSVLRLVCSVSTLSLLSALVVCVPAQAQMVSDATGDEETVVTIELIRRTLMTSGNSVILLNSNTLERMAGMETVRDVLETVPNMTPVTGTGKAPTVRGVDGTGPAENANAFFAGSRARLSWRIDGRPASYNEVVFGDVGLWDVDRIEVLRGPQSTLVGRNAIAGTVVIDTRDPEFTLGGAMQIAAGSLNQQRASGTVNLPLIEDRVALRLTADLYQRDSATNYLPYEGVDDPGEVRSVSLRGKLLFVSREDSDKRLMVTLAHVDHKGPNGEIIVRPFEDRNSNYPLQPVHQPRTTSLSAEATLPLSNGFSFEASASITDFEFRRYAAPNTSNARVDTDEYIFEPRLRYKGARGETFVAGLYVYQAKQQESIEFIVPQNFEDNTDTLAAYVEGSLPIGERLEVNLGTRYEREHRERHGGDEAGAIARISSENTYEVFLPKLGLTWRQDAQLTWGMQVSRGYNAGGGGIAFAIPIVNYEYGPEYVWNTEIFGRQRWANSRVRTTQNLFYSRYRDMQLPFDLTPDNSHDEAFVVRNADRVETWGAEFGIEAQLSDHLMARGHLGLLKTEISDYPNSGVEGNALLTAPSVTASGSLFWHSGPVSVAGVVAYTGAYFTDINNRPGGETKARIITDVQANYDFGKVTMYASVKNLFDSRSALARYPGVIPTGGAGSASDYDSAVLVQPRSLLIGLKAGF